MTRVLLVDDQDLVRAGFKTILQSEPGVEVVGEAANGADAIERARELQPDVICMDVQMPGMDGLEATRMLVADASVTAGVLILTTFDRDDYLFEALQAGASGFLLKNARAEELIDAVTIVARGDALLSPSVTRRVISRFAASNAAPAVPTAKPVDTHAVRDLTDRELEVLQLIAAGLSNSEIAGRLYVGEATVKTHVSKVLMKLGLRDRIQAVIFAYEHGLAG